jgi:hypothetical protein
MLSPASNCELRGGVLPASVEAELPDASESAAGDSLMILPPEPLSPFASRYRAANVVDAGMLLVGETVSGSESDVGYAEMLGGEPAKVFRPTDGSSALECSVEVESSFRLWSSL